MSTILKELCELFEYTFVMETLKLAVSRIRIYTWAFNRIDSVLCFIQWFRLASKPLNYTHRCFLVKQKKKTRKIPDKITKMPLNTPETEKRREELSVRIEARFNLCACVNRLLYYYTVFPYCHRNLRCDGDNSVCTIHSVVCSARSNLHEFT